MSLMMMMMMMMVMMMMMMMMGGGVDEDEEDDNGNDDDDDLKIYSASFKVCFEQLLHTACLGCLFPGHYMCQGNSQPRKKKAMDIGHWTRLCSKFNFQPSKLWTRLRPVSLRADVAIPCLYIAPSLSRRAGGSTKTSPLTSPAIHDIFDVSLQVQ